MNDDVLVRFGISSGLRDDAYRGEGDDVRTGAVNTPAVTTRALCTAPLHCCLVFAAVRWHVRALFYVSFCSGPCSTRLSFAA